MSSTEPEVPPSDPDEPLAEPAVPATLYSDEYYRNWNAGYPEWRASEGKTVAGIYPGVLHLAGFRAGETLVDIGTGRGELVAVAVESGAARAIGVEYSEAGVELARQTLRARGTDERGELIFGDARAIPLEDGLADLVTMIDVVEHLSEAELDRVLEESIRLLKPGGRIFIHTMPNRWIYDFTYPVHRRLRRSRASTWPSEPRVFEYERLMHINEQSYLALRRTLRSAGFGRVKVWHGPFVYAGFVPDAAARRVYKLLAKFRLTRAFGSYELFASAVKG